MMYRAAVCIMRAVAILAVLVPPVWGTKDACHGNGNCPASTSGLVQRRAQMKRSETVDTGWMEPEVQSVADSEPPRGGDVHRVARTIKSDDLYEGCKAKQLKASPVLQEVSEDHTVNVSKTACGHDEILLRKFTATGATESCCSEADPHCSGCALWDSGASLCASCAGGFVPRSGVCVACLHSAGWSSSDGRTCQQLSAADCSDMKFHGLSSNEACCNCGGGVVSPTPFVYDTSEFVVGEAVHMLPKPRTASRYGVDADCALTEYNLTIDGTTGEVTYAPGLDAPKEAFSVTCKVTAYQAAHVVYTTSVTVSVKDLTYGAMPVVFTSATTLPLRKTAGHWSNLALNCAPKGNWLHLDAATGSIQVVAEAAGAVDNVQDTYEGQMGGVCEISGNWTADPAVPSHKKTAKILVVKPKPLASLQYSAASISTAVGEKMPAVELKQGGEDIMMPSMYDIACDDQRFVFDSLLGVGMFDGHPIIQVASNGQIVLDVPKSFESVFDAMLGSSATDAWKISFACKIFGVFSDSSLPAISAGLSVAIRDTTCWAQDSVQGLAAPLQPLAGPAPVDEATCRKLCRVRSSCAYYVWDQAGCSQVTKRADGGWLQATAKIWNCSNTDTCREVRTSTWYYNGIYCPVGADALRNSIIYYKAGTTPEEQLFLHHHSESVDGAVTDCADRSWVIKGATAADYKKPQSGYFEMHGQVLSCPQVTEVRFATLPCGQPENTTEEEVKVQKLVLDDPATPAAADYWLHPCECAPAAWGPDAPVDPVAFEMTGDAGGATYVPPPLMLVSGEFVCPTRNLLPNPGVYFESETETMEYEVCEAKCKNHEDCNYFWHGTQSSATTCRLYSACDSLVREMGLEGDLMAMPRSPGCVVANPSECWTVSMRRKFLTDVAAESFRYWNLHAQCDMMLLLGGSGINACGRPSYRPHDYADWTHKKKLPASFEHGLTLKASCWTERYSGVRGSIGTSQEVLTCVNGNWFNSADQPGLGNFDCFECVQVASNGFNKIEQRREQELYFFNRMQLSIHSEVNQLGSDKIHCMEPKEPMDTSAGGQPLTGSWLHEASSLYKRTPIETLVLTLHGLSGTDRRTFDDWRTWAQDQGGRLATFEEAWDWVRENHIFYARNGWDVWAPTLELNGTKDWIQLGSVAWAAPGLSHNKRWGWPAWADDASKQGWGYHGAGILWMKKITVNGASREMERLKYKILSKQVVGDPRMTWNESKAWAASRGGRLMRPDEAILWARNNPKWYADGGHDMWVPVEDADGTRDYIQAGRVPWAPVGQSHNAKWAWPGWADDASKQGWFPDERLMLWVKKELVTSSVWPGDVIALRNPQVRRFVRAHSDQGKVDVSGQSEIPMPERWTWERFVVVDFGYGDVALYNPHNGGYLRMKGTENKMDQARIKFDALPADWAWEKFQIQELGDGAIGLWNAWNRRWLRVRGDGWCDGSPHVGALGMHNGWTGERLQVQHLDYAMSKGMVSWFKSEDAAPNWRSAVGDFAGVASEGEAKVYEAKGLGAAAPVKYLWGTAGDSRTTRTKYNFGNVLKHSFTICSVSRYLSALHKGRILQGSRSDIIHGHWNGNVGVVHYAQWSTEPYRNKDSTIWVVVCGSNMYQHTLVDGNDVGKHDGSRRGGDDVLTIHEGPGTLANEASDWAVMEVMTWNYGLSLEEMKNASAYLQQKVNKGQPDNCVYEVLNIPEMDRTYSSLGVWHADKSMLDNTVGGWCPSSASFHGSEALDEWMQFDLKVVKPVGGIVVQGKHGLQEWMWSFKVQYKEDVGSDWNTIDTVFTGNSQQSDEKTRVFFTSPVQARFVRLTYFKFKGWACIRSAVILCNSIAANEMILTESSTCSSTFRVEKRPDADPESRHLVLASGAGAGRAERCVAYGMHESKEIIVHKPCQADDASQLIPARTMGLMYLNLHSSNKVSIKQRGLRAEFFYGLQPSTDTCAMPDIRLRQPDFVRVDAQLDFALANGATWPGLTESDYVSGRWTGFLNVKYAGTYTFFFEIDDSVEAFLDGKLLFSQTTCGHYRDIMASMDLPAGDIPFSLQWFELRGGMRLRLEYQGLDTGDQRVLIPTSAFMHMSNADTALMTDISHSRGCIGNTGLASLRGSVFAPNGQATGVACGFVPVVKADSPTVLPTSRTKNGHWPEWWSELQDMDIECGEGKVLMSIDTEWVANKMRVAFTCGLVAGLGFCTPSWTDQRDAHRWDANDQQILSKLKVACPAGSLLNKLKFEYSIGGRWARFKTSCCEIGGPPVAVIRTGPDASRYDAMEGEYCPSGRGPSGRFEYQQRSLGPWQTIGAGHAMGFDHVNGKWCISGLCSVPVPVDPLAPGNADPISITLAALDVGPVSDFDGNFEAKGVTGGSPNGNKYLGKKLPRNPPKRPKPPRKPKLLEYEPQMPKYSDKCVEYGDLWKNLHETVVNDVGEDEATVSKLETEEEEPAGYQDAHPCDVAGDAGGTSGKIGGGDGSATRDQMPYDQLDGCHARDIERALVDGKESFWHDNYETTMDLADNIVGMICTVIPIAAIEPFGAGISVASADICGGIKDLVTSAATSAAAYRQTKFYYDMAKEDYADCNPLQTNFARLFCDIHCVRDAVIRGDRSIIRNLKQATDVTNKNLDQLSSWIVKSAQVDAGWLADKIDYAAAVNARDFESLKTMMGGDDQASMLTAIRQATVNMKSELLGLAQAASFGTASALTARDALQRFADQAPMLQGEPNASKAFEALEALTSLKARLHHAAQGRSKMDQLGTQLTGGIAHMQSLARLNAKALGVYKHFQNASKHLHHGHGHGSLRRAQHEVLTSLDKIWWSLRGKMDKYFDAADEEVQSFQSALAMMQDYQQCHSGYQNLLSTYKATMRTASRTHKLLRSTWRECSNLVGELASTMADSDAFNVFLDQEGCASSLAKQTRNQAHLAVSGMRLLWHRFQVAGLAAPDTGDLSDAVQRLEESYSDAVTTQGCK